MDATNVPVVVSPEEELKQVEAEKSGESNIVEDIAAFIRRFVFLREDALYDLAAGWVVATYLTDLFDYFGYLFAHSPEPQSGKSRLLDVLGYLVKSAGDWFLPQRQSFFGWLRNQRYF